MIYKPKKLDRTCRYRGVSKNGKSWQILSMIDHEKVYLGTHNDPKIAAMIYDIAIL